MRDTLVAVDERVICTSAKQSAAAFSTSVGYKSTPSKVALG